MTCARHSHIRNLIGISAVFVAAGCRGDLTAPDHRSPSDAVLSKQGVLTGDAPEKIGLHRHKAKNGDVYTIDHARSTLTNSKGKSVRLSPELRDKMEVSFDHMNVIDDMLSRFQSDPGYAEHSANESGKKHKLFRVKQPSLAPGGVAPNILAPSASGKSPGAAATRIQAPSKISSVFAIDDGSICADLWFNIQALTPAYEQARADYDAQLALVTGDGLKTEPELIDLWDAVELEVKLAEMRMLLGQLNILAVQYNSYGCWTNDWQVPPDQPLTGTAGGGSGGGGGGGLYCEWEYVEIDVSSDDGLTWQVWWEGSAQVCW